MIVEQQECYYYEVLVYLVLCSVSLIEWILVIGGGDGGIVWECLCYLGVQWLDMVEIDGCVVEFSWEYFFDIGGFVWFDLWFQFMVGDGIVWVVEVEDQSYDVVLVDGFDFVGFVEGLFNCVFFENC